MKLYMNLVEDPNENFADLRDKNDMRMLIDADAFKGLKAPVSDEFVDMARQKYKLTKVSRERELGIEGYRKRAWPPTACEIILRMSTGKANMPHYSFPATNAKVHRDISFTASGQAQGFRLQELSIASEGKVIQIQLGECHEKFNLSILSPTHACLVRML
jgi:hypothetical protein